LREDVGTPTAHPKKRMEQIKRKLIEKEIKAEMKSIDGQLMTLCAFDKKMDEAGNLIIDGGKSTGLLEILLTKDSRWKDGLKNTFKNPLYYKEQYIYNLKKVISADRLYVNGLLPRYRDLLKKISIFTNASISPLNNELRYKQVQAIEDAGLLSNKSLTALKLKTYSICDDLRDDWGDKIKYYCTNNDNMLIREMLEEEYEEKKTIKTTNLYMHLSIQELSLLHEKVKSGEKFIIYRGFAIGHDNEKHKVRKGLKTDDDLYYLQNSGGGLSFTLKENVAFFFAYRGITDGMLQAKQKKSRYYKPVEEWYIPNEEGINLEKKSIREFRLQKKLRPIVAKYECDPTKITGYNFNTNEAEVIVKVEDLKLLHYEIPHSLKIAKELWEWRNKSALHPKMLRYGAIADGLTAFCDYDENTDILTIIYAETEEVRESLEDIIDCGEYPTKDAYDNLKRIFLDNAVHIPVNINPIVFGNGLFEYMKHPTDIIREKGKYYQIAKRKLVDETCKIVRL
jgi:hypothetical protein